MRHRSLVSLISVVTCIACGSGDEGDSSTDTALGSGTPSGSLAPAATDTTGASPQPAGSGSVNGEPIATPTVEGNPAGSPTSGTITGAPSVASAPAVASTPSGTSATPVATDPTSTPVTTMTPVGTGGVGTGGDSGSNGGSSGMQAGSGGALPMGTACVAPEDPQTLTEFIIPSRPVEEQCAYCHGANGEGGELAPMLGYPYEDFFEWVIRTGREHPDFEDEMPAFTEEEFGEECLQGVVDFLSARPKPTTGEELYLSYCGNCHGSDGAGGVTERPIAQEPADEHIEHSRAGAHPGEYDNRPEYMPAIDANVLSDEEIQQIADYLQSL